eukprot:COSAG02_NODE_2269_length_9270_cov_17.410642_7_plen_205_part_00
MGTWPGRTFTNCCHAAAMLSRMFDIINEPLEMNNLYADPSAAQLVTQYKHMLCDAVDAIRCPRATISRQRRGDHHGGQRPAIEWCSGTSSTRGTRGVVPCAHGVRCWPLRLRSANCALRLRSVFSVCTFSLHRDPTLGSYLLPTATDCKSCQSFTFLFLISTVLLGLRFAEISWRFRLGLLVYHLPKDFHDLGIFVDGLNEFLV